MASGNFLIGEGLTLEGFKQFVQPIFLKEKYLVKDVLAPYRSHNSQILVSIVGEGFLERVVNDVLVESGADIEKSQLEARNLNQSSGQDYTPTAYSHQISTFSHWQKKEGEKDVRINKGLYKIIGLYDADDTASKLFPVLAQEYLLNGIKQDVDALAKQLKDIMNKKLSEFH